MNKEFKKLLEASYTKGFEECARTGHKVGQLDAIFNSIVMGEFAELIVRECIDWIDGSPSTDAGQLVLTKSFIVANIKDHFGVE
jgi:hypothetical protein